MEKGKSLYSLKFSINQVKNKLKKYYKIKANNK